MSRIVGLATPKSQVESGQTGHRLQLMLDGAVFGYSEHRVPWRVESLQIEAIALGWTGSTNGKVTNRNRVSVVLDGNIYNHDDWAGNRNDAELIADLYAEYGFLGTVQRLNGDFAIALHDHTTNELWLGRDRLGVRPLYYWHQRDQFAFASRPRALLALPEVHPEVNRRFVALFAASHYRTFDNDPHVSSYLHIQQVPASHILSYRNGQFHLEVYWQLEEQSDWNESESVLAERYRDLLLDSVTRRFALADRPSFTLSGGMDSSSVLACAVQSTGSRQYAFSTVYHDKTYDESEEIYSMLDTYVEQWYPIEIGMINMFDLIDQMITIHDEPVATATWLSHFLLCQQVQQKGFSSLLGGLGGDELNAGEYEYFPFYFADLAASGRKKLLALELTKWSEYHDHPIFCKSPKIGLMEVARLTDPTMPGRCLPDRDRFRQYFSALNPDYFDLNTFEPVMDHPFRSYLKNRTYQDLFRETAPCCLRAEDRQANAFGLENFLPF